MKILRNHHVAMKGNYLVHREHNWIFPTPIYAPEGPNHDKEKKKGQFNEDSNLRFPLKVKVAAESYHPGRPGVRSPKVRLEVLLQVIADLRPVLMNRLS